MKHYRKGTLEDGLRIISKLRKEDKAEVAGMGMTMLHVPFGLVVSEHATFFHYKGEPAGIAGVVRLNQHEGQIWMLCTPAITKAPITFVRQAKKWLDSIESDYKLLWNLADARNTVHHKLLKHLGFKGLRVVPTGPNALPYYEIVKLCVLSQQEPLP